MSSVSSNLQCYRGVGTRRFLKLKLAILIQTRPSRKESDRVCCDFRSIRDILEYVFPINVEFETDFRVLESRMVGRGEVILAVEGDGPFLRCSPSAAQDELSKQG